jgi:transposase-like protein
MLGPIYLHWDGTYDSYHAFFSHLQCKLDNITLTGMEVGIGDLLVGSDEEKALTKAIQRCFPQSSLLLCTRHLEENARRRLRDKIGASKACQQEILQQIFGPDGLTSAEDTFIFDKLSHEVQTKCEETVPLFTNYLQQKLIPAIRKHVVTPRHKQETIDKLDK